MIQKNCVPDQTLAPEDLPGLERRSRCRWNGKHTKYGKYDYGTWEYLELRNSQESKSAGTRGTVGKAQGAYDDEKLELRGKVNTVSTADRLHHTEWDRRLES